MKRLCFVTDRRQPGAVRGGDEGRGLQAGGVQAEQRGLPQRAAVLFPQRRAGGAHRHVGPDQDHRQPRPLLRALLLLQGQHTPLISHLSAPHPTSSVCVCVCVCV